MSLGDRNVHKKWEAHEKARLADIVPEVEAVEADTETEKPARKKRVKK